MKNIPNFITLLNLFFGCCSIVTTLTAYPYFRVSDQDNNYLQITGMEDLYWGALFIFLAAAMDLLDGLAARVLDAESAMGEVLDSLADVVSFGVAPGMILYQMLWYGYVSHSDAFEQPSWALLPAFILACAGAWRLARFNTFKGELPKHYFLGLPIPAAGLFVAGLPLSLLFDYNTVGIYLSNIWVLYGIIFLLSYLMVSNIKFRKWNSGIKSLSSGWPIYVTMLAFIVALIFIPYSAVLVAMVVYLLLSLLVPYHQLDKA